jgi:hypothetical protein
MINLLLKSINSVKIFVHWNKHFVIDICGIIDCDTFWVAPSIMNKTVINVHKSSYLIVEGPV